MKEERKYYEWKMVDNKILFRKMFISFLVVVSIGSFITYDFITSITTNKINSYSELDYLYLDKVAGDIIKEVGIDLTSLPNEVEYECVKKDDKIIVMLDLSDKVMFWGEHPSIELKLSKDFKILNKHRNYNSKEDYLYSAKKCNIIISILLGSFYWVFIWLLALEISQIASKFSSRKRKKF